MKRREFLQKAGMGVAVGVSVARIESLNATEGSTLAEQLGFKKEDRLLILHADDLGMCHAVNVASIKGMTEGIVTCGSVMVPCPWFPEIAAWARSNPDADLGLHLTLNSEWQYYRWRPVSPWDKVRGLIDKEGFMWRDVASVRENAKAEEVEMELRAQIERALEFGMKPTHIDTHMGTCFSRPDFFEVYVRLGAEYGILPMLPAPTPQILAMAKQLGIDYQPIAVRLKQQGFVFIDNLVTGGSGDTLEERRKSYYEIIRNLPSGVSEIILHLSTDDPEIRAITGAWQYRYHEFLIFTELWSPNFKNRRYTFSKRRSDKVVLVRRFIVPFNLTTEHVALTDKLAHRILRVLRMKVGDQILLCDPRGVEWVAEIVGTEFDVVRVRLLEPNFPRPEPKTFVTLFQGIPKGEKMDFIVQKATELGVQRIVPMFTRRTIVQLSPDKAKSKRERWQRVAVSATEQSGGKIVPEIALPLPFKKALDEAAKSDLWLLFYEAAEEPLKEVVTPFRDASHVAIMIGPEGGFDPSEVAEAKRMGAQVVSLGKRILRTETAAIVAVALVLYELGQLER
jgi:RsmE family RNA methyltransferase